MKSSDFNYDLPPGLIARYPAARRDAARLLVLRRDGVQDAGVADLPALLPRGSLLVLNDTRVRPARLFLSPGDGAGELLLLQALGDGIWLALGKPGRKLKAGRKLAWPSGLAAEVIAVRPTGEREIRFAGELEKYLEQHGAVPLPPYLQREAEPSDRERYQTVYARAPGAVAAPTAGLHFTPQLLDAVRAAGMDTVFLTLHTGVGTFRPLQGETLDDHTLAAEYAELPEATAAAVNDARRAGRPVIAVGTTVVRTLEAMTGEDGVTRAGSGWYDLFIRPGHRFRAIDGMLTNFHLPKSSLLVLVSALAGHARIMAAYRHAIAQQYRFFSYGDAMLILPEARAMQLPL